MSVNITRMAGVRDKNTITSAAFAGSRPLPPSEANTRFALKQEYENSVLGKKISFRCEESESVDVTKMHDNGH